MSLTKKYHDAMVESAQTFDRHGSHGSPRFFHADAGAESAFTARQLEALRPGVIAQSFPDLKWSTLLPVNTSAPNGAAQFTATTSTQAGRPAVTKSMDGIVPRSDLAIQQTTIDFYSIMLSYGYSYQEARNAMMAGVPLQAQKATNCREQMERELDDIMFIGGVGSTNQTTTGTKLAGLLTLTGTDTYTILGSGAGGSLLWTSKSSDDIIRDLNGPSLQMAANTDGIEIPDTMILPISQRDLIGTVRVGDGTSATILAYFLANNPYIKGDIQTTFKAETLGSGSTHLGMVYRKDANKLEAVISQPFEQFPPQTVSMDVVTNCHIRTAGVFCYRPKSVSYFNGF